MKAKLFIGKCVNDVKEGKILKTKARKQKSGQQGALALTSRAIYRDLAPAKSNSSEMKNSVKFVKRCQTLS